MGDGAQRGAGHVVGHIEALVVADVAAARQTLGQVQQGVLLMCLDRDAGGVIQAQQGGDGAVQIGVEPGGRVVPRHDLRQHRRPSRQRFGDQARDLHHLPPASPAPRVAAQDHLQPGFDATGQGQGQPMRVVDQPQPPEPPLQRADACRHRRARQQFVTLVHALRVGDGDRQRHLDLPRAVAAPQRPHRGCRPPCRSHRSQLSDGTLRQQRGDGRIAAGAVPGQGMRGQHDASGTGVQIHARQIAHTVRVGACDQVFADRQADKVQRAAPVGGHRAFLGQGHAGQRLGAGMHPVAEDHRLFGGQPVGCGVRPRQALSADRGDPMTAGLHAAGQGGACRSVIACQSVQDQRQRQVRVDGARSVRPVPDQPADTRQARCHRRIGHDLQPAAGDRDQIAPAAQLAPVADQ